MLVFRNRLLCFFVSLFESAIRCLHKSRSASFLFHRVVRAGTTFWLCPLLFRSQHVLGYALPRHHTASLLFTATVVVLAHVRPSFPNYALKGTSVETLDSSERSSGASVPYLGC